jgi:uncharacterized protein (TIGR03435 family)
MRWEMSSGGAFLLVGTILYGMNAISAVRAQSSQLKTPTFEVASIKRGCTSRPQNRAPGRGLGQSPIGLNECGTLTNFIITAYVEYEGGHRGPRQRVPILGGPSWIDSDTYQINARAESASAQSIIKGSMLQALLENRFKLRIRRETREIPVYALTTTKGGFKLQPSKASCVNPDYASSIGPDEQFCGVPYIRIVGAHFVFDIHGTLDEFSRWVREPMLDRPVINQTGIAGTYDFHLEFAPDEDIPDAASGRTSDRPIIFDAFREQLGLRLDPDKGPGTLIFVEHVERPTEN